MLAVFTVNSTLDNGDGANLTLREAIEQAQNTPGPDTINFDPAVFNTPKTILLTQGELFISQSVTIDGTVDGDGPSDVLLGITIDASGNDPTPNSTLEDGIDTNDGDGSTVFYIEGAGAVEINGLTLTGGDTDAGSLDAHGGAVSVFNASLTLRNSLISGNVAEHGGGVNFVSPNSSSVLNVISTTIRDNSASLRGGGISINALYSSANIQGSVIAGNEARGTGGGVYAQVRDFEIVETTISGNVAHAGAGGGVEVRLGFKYSPYASKLEIDRSTISGNTADMKGGGLFVLLAGTVDDRFVLSNSTISGNHALNGVGGGAYVCQKFGGKFEAINSTISGNDALHATNGRGGGLAIAREFGAPLMESHLSHLTITDNRATSGGGLYSSDDSLVRTYVNHTIISGNRNAANQSNNVGGNIENTSAYNLFGTGGGAVLTPATLGPGNILNNNDPKLGPLTYNGGRTPTHALLPGNSMSLGSPAINAGDPSIMHIETAFDQRGNPWYRVELIGDRIDIGAFEYQLNPLPGDYNFDGLVDAADYTVWRNTLGSMIDLRADGDGNGMIDGNDYVVWKNQYGQPMADASGNSVTDFADHLIWLATYGSTTDLRADYNEDGIVDDADYEIWFDTYGSTMEIAAFGMLSSMFGADAPPAVVGVALGLPGVGTMDFANKVGSGEQVRSVPLIAANTLNITFSRDVNVTAGALELVNLDGASPTLFGFSYDALAQTATWTFQTSLADGRYLARVSDSVEDLDGRALDGEFFNPWSLGATGTSIFPSGDGDEGGEFRFRFTVLSGDSDRDNIEGATNFENWHSIEPGMIIVTTTADEFDADLSFGDVSLREAVHYANTAGTATTIQLPAGRYVLTRVGTEGSDTAHNDLDVLSTMAIIGNGAGVSVIVPGWSSAATNDNRLLEVSGSAAHLRIRGVTLANSFTFATYLGAAALVRNQAQLEILDSAIVNNSGYDSQIAVHSMGSDLTVRRSVFTNNHGADGEAVLSHAWGGNSGSLTIGESIFALNANYNDPTPNVRVIGSVALANLGKNLFDNATGGFFDVLFAASDHLGVPQYVVTTLADTFDHTDDNESLSLREAIDSANQATGPQTIWMPAWRFALTRDRPTYGGGSLTDTSVAFGDLDLKKSMTICGVSGRTSVEWKAGIVDKVFDLLGDFNEDGSVDAADYTVWQNQNGSSGGLGQFSADGDDDGEVDYNDYLVWHSNYGHSLQLLDIGL